jgi:hypothetical protein
LHNQAVAWLSTISDLGGRSRIRTWVGLRRRIYSPGGGVPPCCPLSQPCALTLYERPQSPQGVHPCLTGPVTRSCQLLQSHFGGQSKRNRCYIVGRQDGNLRAVQALLGRASPATTERYTTVDDDEVRAAMMAAVGNQDCCSPWAVDQGDAGGSLKRSPNRRRAPLMERPEWRGISSGSVVLATLISQLKL